MTNKRDKKLQGCPNPIVFYDGECAMCSYWVQWILDRDIDRSFRFAALQSRFASELFAAFSTELSMRSLVVFTEEGEFLSRSTAVSFLFTRLRPGAFFERLINILPRFLSDIGYDAVAAVRKLVRQNHCRLFTAAERTRFLNHIKYLEWAKENFLVKSQDSFPQEDKKE